VQGVPVGQLEHDPSPVAPAAMLHVVQGVDWGSALMCPVLHKFQTVPDALTAAPQTLGRSTTQVSWKQAARPRDGVNADTAKENTWESQNKGSAK
jgi:hypothetical protein